LTLDPLGQAPTICSPLEKETISDKVLMKKEVIQRLLKTEGIELGVFEDRWLEVLMRTRGFCVEHTIFLKQFLQRLFVSVQTPPSFRSCQLEITYINHIDTT
jgi:hypothetical protein